MTPNESQSAFIETACVMSTRFSAALLILLGLSIAGSACGDRSSSSARPTVVGPAPDSFRVAFETSRGAFVVEVKRDLAPKGADRFYELVSQKFFEENRFFRVLPGFIAQFGVNNDRKINEQWEAKTIADDSVRQSNVRGTIVFAMDGKNSRAHQIFINFADNPSLDKQGFAPFGRVVEGMSIVDSIYSGYGESPSYHLVATLGNSYLTRMFPKLDYIKTAKIVESGRAAK